MLLPCFQEKTLKHWAFYVIYLLFLLSEQSKIGKGSGRKQSRVQCWESSPGVSCLTFSQPRGPWGCDFSWVPAGISLFPSSVELFSSPGSVLPLNTRKAFWTCSSFWQGVLNSVQLLLSLWNMAQGKAKRKSQGADSTGKWSAGRRGRAEQGSELCPEQTSPHS